MFEVPPQSCANGRVTAGAEKIAEACRVTEQRETESCQAPRQVQLRWWQDSKRHRNDVVAGVSCGSMSGQQYCGKDDGVLELSGAGGTSGRFDRPAKAAPQQAQETSLEDPLLADLFASPQEAGGELNNYTACHNGTEWTGSGPSR